MNADKLRDLTIKLISLPKEIEWVEFKCNFVDPQEIGEYISAISNSAALCGVECGYIIWGIDDLAHKAVGTTFKPRQTKKGGEEIEAWLARLLFPRVHFLIYEFEYEGNPMVLFDIPAALHTPIRFQNIEFIRIGSYKKKLHEYPEKERALWTIFQPRSFEQGFAELNVKSEDVLALIDYPKMFELLDIKLPDNRDGIIEQLLKERVITLQDDGCYNITNLGAVLFAKRLDQFSALSRKTIRVIIYDGANRFRTLQEQTGAKGYAVGFNGLIKFINDQLPQNEQIEQALRNKVTMYPQEAVRELVANAIIHQDFSITGTGPMVEIFKDRIEITNPGTPLINPLRFIDEPPRSRNELLATAMRRSKICEERGSGVDKVILLVELFQLPAPDFQVTSSHTKAILYAPKKLSNMSQADRIRACYQHAVLCVVSNKQMTNTSLRERFGLEEKSYALASRIIADSIKSGLIKRADPESRSRKLAKYVPFWLE